MAKPKVIYHGSPNLLIGETLNPSKGEDSIERPENNLLAVYGTDRKDLAIMMGVLGCKGVVGGSIDSYKGDKLNARIYGAFPKKKYVYIYHLLASSFKQTKIDKHQFVSFVAVRPLKVEKLEIIKFRYLIRRATKEETDCWVRKYKNKKV